MWNAIGDIVGDWVLQNRKLQGFVSVGVVRHARLGCYLLLALALANAILAYVRWESWWLVSGHLIAALFLFGLFLYLWPDR